jgi:protein-export membrane protein SecD
MLYFSRSKILLIFLAIFFSILFASPNVFNENTINNFPSFLPKQKVNLGLDLQGGSHLLLEVDTGVIVSEKIENLTSDLRKLFKKKNLNLNNVSSNKDSLTFISSAVTSEINSEIEDLSVSSSQNLMQVGDRTNLILDIDDNFFKISFSEEYITQLTLNAVNQSLEIVRRRIDELGTKEPTIQRQGTSRIIIQLPGIDNPDEIKSLLGQTAKLTFQLVDQTASYDPNKPNKAPIGSEVLPSDSIPDYSYIVKKRIMVGGENLVDAQPGFDPQTNEPIVSFRFDRVGAKKFGRVTKDNIGKPFAIILDDRVVSAPVIRDAILGGSGQISGGFNASEANELAILLRAGALPAPLIILEERSVGPDLGADSVNSGKIAAMIGFGAVIVFMIIIYRRFGFFADIALIINLVMVLGVLSLLQATLTLPGIAGIILTIGMAVDANVLIFERIKEELRNGSSMINSVDNGYKRALSTIMDANITTLIAAIILFFMASGPVRGFSITLAIGIFTSVFTAFTVTRYFISLNIRKLKAINLGLKL